MEHLYVRFCLEHSKGKRKKVENDFSGCMDSYPVTDQSRFFFSSPCEHIISPFASL
jgi:hypothetical protein